MFSSPTVISERKIHKPYHFPAIITQREMVLNNSSTEMAAIRFVRDLGIRPNLSGYHLLIKAITLSLSFPELLSSLTKELYPRIASECGKNVRSVERNIRKAIDSAYEYDPERIQSIFYYKVDKPYISEVISLAVETIRYNINNICQ